ncbi:immune inhibitor A [candidate division KSB1 bacterium]|nr:immune inhibitor A [candidate division KSB1 bacterium]
MKKSVLVFVLVFSVLFAFSAFAAKDASKSVQLQMKKSAMPEKPGRAELYRTDAVAENPVIWEDDFEGGQPAWVANPGWKLSDNANGAKDYQPNSCWQPTETNSSSPTHSWNATEDFDTDRDMLISPIITLPEQVETGGVVSPLKGVKISYNFDVDTPQASQSNAYWHVFFYRVESHWALSDHAAAGDAAYFLDQHDGTTDGNGRQWLFTPEIDLTGAVGTVNLTFSHDYETEEQWDFLVLQVSTDGFETYTYIHHWGDVGASGGFVQETFDLSQFIGETIQIRFEANTDDATRVGFWAIDEIKVADDNGDLFYDGAEDPQMDADGFVQAVAQPFGGIIGGAQATPAWDSRIVDVPSFNEIFFPGDDVRIAFMWHADGDETKGRGLFIDDVQLLAVGIPPNDLAISGLIGHSTVALNKEFAPVLKVTNTGLENISGQIGWQGTIKDGEGNTAHLFIGSPARVTDMAPDSTIELGILPGREWTPTVPGVYELSLQLNFADGDATNNTATVNLMIPGGMFTTPLYHTDFIPYLGEQSLEDFGWTVINGGGNDILGTNVNKWEMGGIISEYADGLFNGAYLSWAWGVLELGPDEDAVMDSSEVLEEYLISPPIDVSGLNPDNTLAVRYYTYYRPSYPGYSPPFGTQVNAFMVDWTVDGGKTWHPAFEFVNDDSAYSGSRDRLPHMAYGGDPLVGNYLAHMNTDLTPALHAAKASGSETVWVRFGVYCEDSYMFGASVEDVMVYAGMNAPVITELADVPEDNGKQLHLTFQGSPNDLVFQWPGFDMANQNDVGDMVAYPVTHYEIWRVNDPTTLGATYTGVFESLQAMAEKVSAPAQGELYYIEGESIVIDYVGSIPATAFPQKGLSYGYVVPTLWDDMPTVILITARTMMPDVFGFSQPQGAMSKDNLAPAAPAGLAVSTQGNTNTLVWEEAYTPVDDVKFYSVYRSEQSGVYGAALATTADLAFMDETAEVGKSYFYVVTATDFAGNESDKSGEGNVITSVASDKAGVPTEFALYQNYPNPFNPTTTVEYALPKASEVVVSIYNTNGQLIQTIEAGYQDAGYQKLTWDASNAPAGLYFLQLKAGSFTKMIKMTLLK